MLSNVRQFGRAFATFWCSGFVAKLFVMVSLLFMLVPTTQAQDDGQDHRGWEVDKSDPPPLGNPVTPIKKPVKIEQFAFLFHEVCEPVGDSVGYTGKWTFDILSAYTSVGYEHSESDSLVVLKLRGRSRVEQGALICFPSKPFTLCVILGDDTAVFRMDLTAGTFVYVDTSSLLRVELPKEIPDGFVAMQFMDRDKDRARDFADQVSKQFGAAVKRTILSEGYYPCLPTSSVRLTNIGRKQLLNETDLGFLVCFQVVNRPQITTVSEWISRRQIEEYHRISNQFGMKGGN
jgi:hypothetical protein